MPDFIYLASQSPRRSQLLQQLGVRHELLLPNAPGDVPEDAEAIEAVLPGEAPRDYVQRVTALKLDAAVARWARRGLPPAPVLTSDTTVALGTEILGKPEDAAQAQTMLRKLQEGGRAVCQQPHALRVPHDQARQRRTPALRRQHHRWRTPRARRIEAARHHLQPTLRPTENGCGTRNEDSVEC